MFLVVTRIGHTSRAPRRECSRFFGSRRLKKNRDASAPTPLVHTCVGTRGSRLHLLSLCRDTWLSQGEVFPFGCGAFPPQYSSYCCGFQGTASLPLCSRLTLVTLRGGLVFACPLCTLVCGVLLCGTFRTIGVTMGRVFWRVPAIFLFVLLTQTPGSISGGFPPEILFVPNEYPFCSR